MRKAQKAILKRFGARARRAAEGVVVDEFVLLSLDDVGGVPYLRARLAGGVALTQIPGRRLGEVASANELVAVLRDLDSWVRAAADPSFSRDDVVAIERTADELFSFHRHGLHLPTLRLGSGYRSPARIEGDAFDALGLVLRGTVAEVVLEATRTVRTSTGGWGLETVEITGGGVDEEAGRRRFAEHARTELRALLPQGYLAAYDAGLAEAAATYDGKYGVVRPDPGEGHPMGYDPNYDLEMLKVQVAERFGSRVTFLGVDERSYGSTKLEWGLDPVLASPPPPGARRAVEMGMSLNPGRKSLRTGVTLRNGVYSSELFWEKIPSSHGAESVAYKLDMIDRYVQLLLGEEE